MKKNYIIGIIIVVAIQFLVIGYLGYQVNSLAKTVSAKVSQIDALKTKADLLASNMKAADDKNMGMAQRANIGVALCSNCVVTDKVFVQFGRMSLTRDEAYLDIKPQPSYEKYFEGQGKVNLSDRDLKANLQEVINTFDNLYSDWQQTSHQLPDFGNLSISIGANGYELATYTNGKIKLSGE